jgi:hypothetical protein
MVKGVDGSSSSDGFIWNHEAAAKGDPFFAAFDTGEHSPLGRYSKAQFLVSAT